MKSTKPYNIEWETLIIPGLKKTYRIMQISDSHMSPDSEMDDEATRERAAKQRQVWMKYGNGISQEDNFRYLIEYGKTHHCDLFLFPGDMVDFPSKGTSHEAYLAFEKAQNYMYVPGNHEQGEPYYAYYKEATGGSPDIQVKELDELLVVGVDNGCHTVSDTVMQKLQELLRGNRPVILLHHIPLDTETLHPAATAFWGDITYFLFGIAGKGENIDNYYALLNEEKTALKAILAGHLHFSHVDFLKNGIPQYVSAPCLNGYARILEITGE